MGLNTISVLQAWVLQHQLQNYSSSAIGWIFSACPFFLHIAGAHVGEPFSAMCERSVAWVTLIFALWLTAGASEAAITASAVVFGF
ncbi:hypothetical protein CC78DRAFT_577637 [Lojkania enalia]|uniref:Uncharacterized protein n=1 Tax=Lojkania enalia TaxID=147567 RepID=A0A9P4KD86_9PLEO|nr:hypothetical protein CC78DRAFT_577637 [Didymosphaeria enalia]